MDAAGGPRQVECGRNFTLAVEALSEAGSEPVMPSPNKDSSVIPAPEQTTA